MTRIKVAILKGRKELQGSSGVDYFALNLFNSLQKSKDIDVTLIYGNYLLPGIFKFLPFRNLNEFDVIHNCIPGLGVLIGHTKPIITTFYDDLMFRPDLLDIHYSLLDKVRARLLKKLWTWGMTIDIQKSDFIVAISEYSKRTLLTRFSIDPRRIVVVPPGVDTDVYKPIPVIQKERTTRKLRLFYCGRISFRKGVDLLLDAVKILVEKANFSSVELFLAGSVDRKFDYAKMIDQRDLNNKVHYLGNISKRDLAIQYNLADVFTFPSRIEGYGIPPLEALACGTKVVSTNVPSIVPFKDIIVVDTKPDILAKGILKAQKLPFTPSRSRQLIIKQYSTEYVTKEYIRIYRRIVGLS